MNDIILPTQKVVSALSSTLGTLSSIQADLSSPESITPIVVLVQQMLRKLQKKDYPEDTAEVVSIKDGIDASILAMVSFTEVHPESDVSLLDVRRALIDSTGHIREIITAHIIQQQLSSIVGDLGMQITSLGSAAPGMLRVSLNKKSDAEDEKPDGSQKPKIH